MKMIDIKSISKSSFVRRLISLPFGVMSWNRLIGALTIEVMMSLCKLICRLFDDLDRIKSLIRTKIEEPISKLA